MQYKANPSGYHTSLTDDAHKKIIDAVPQVIIKARCAALAGVSRTSLQSWLDQGERDLGLGTDSVFARLAYDFNMAQAKVIRDKLALISDAAHREDGKVVVDYKPISWQLEKCFREDFGADSAAIQDILLKLTEMEKQMQSAKSALGGGVIENQTN